jgi:hypothetical protein
MFVTTLQNVNANVMLLTSFMCIVFLAPRDCGAPLPLRAARFFPNGVEKMSSNVSSKVSDVLAQVSAENAELRTSIAALIAATAQTNETVAALAQASLVKTRAPRTAKIAVQMSPADADAAMCGFVKKGPRRDFFLAVRELPNGVYPLADFAGVSLADAQVVYRRLSGLRTGGRVTESFFERLGFSLAIDNEVRGKADIHVIRAEKAAEENAA